MSGIRDEFRLHALNDRGLELATALGEIFSRTLTEIETLVPHGHERSLALIHLQEASGHCKRGIAAQKENQK